MSKFDHYTVIPNINTNSVELFLPTTEDINNCEQQLGFTFEEDYNTFMRQYGTGILGGTYIRIYSPTRITKGQSEWLERVTQYYFWEDGEDILTKEQVLESICIGDTLDGDEIIFYQNQYYVLPRYEENIYALGATLNDAIEWLCTAGILTEAFVEREFEPFNE
ncbi:SMI1/KNR4 family protein [Myroides marinus]|uniref:SMI1/KNR4 family protein n=1 Tax=Myroides marinus TaxID=703342 RepID=UPI002576E0B6|nr:SMI1/KNR4 family protein [Myroides marinus]MDM1349202.1 SMI1/KNR4 family protein [Myroides marinus]MDM1352847.1 SMI1/KNR4 family protein [Myroides marinus]MDM1356412.1 SMI1/KNR4 family protein [Myroides marinus]MDM1363355.1 SMI1/KNR4 family protein [Myroides marinus]MDM1367621.1 SMI1/KNR4 family protein [Myroides marinus]